RVRRPDVDHHCRSSRSCGDRCGPPGRAAAPPSSPQRLGSAWPCPRGAVRAARARAPPAAGAAGAAADGGVQEQRRADLRPVREPAARAVVAGCLPDDVRADEHAPLHPELARGLCAVGGFGAGAGDRGRVHALPKGLAGPHPGVPRGPVGADLPVRVDHGLAVRTGAGVGPVRHPRRRLDPQRAGTVPSAADAGGVPGHPRGDRGRRLRGRRHRDAALLQDLPPAGQGIPRGGGADGLHLRLAGLPVAAAGDPVRREHDHDAGHLPAPGILRDRLPRGPRRSDHRDAAGRDHVLLHPTLFLPRHRRGRIEVLMAAHDLTADEREAPGALGGPPGPRYIRPGDPRTQAALEHWQDLKVGVISHWGLYPAIGQGGSWSLHRERLGEFTDPPEHFTGTDAEYHDWYYDQRRTFRGAEYDPAEWARACSDAGMRYLVFTTKHHDGFSMYDTAYSNLKSTAEDSALGRDVFGETVEAFRAEGLETGVYFSKADWAHPGYWDRARPVKDRFHNY